MKLYIEGNEVELEPTGVVIDAMNDRMVVKGPEGSSTAVAVRSGDATLVSYKGRQYKIERRKPASAIHGAASNGELRAPMPGQIVDVLVALGADVTKGERILVLEAMKTQQAFTAPFDGRLTALNISKGDQVIDGALLAVVTSESEE